MRSDDDGNSDSSPRGGTGRGGIPGREPRRGGGNVSATQELKTVRLVCLFCREVRLIHVPADCDTPTEVLWECLMCQERWASRK